MVDIKISLTIEIPGSSMFSSQSCEENGKPIASMHNVNSIRLLDKNGKFKEEIKYLTRKCVPARQHLNICRDAYNYFISSEEPFGYTDYRVGKHWKNLSKMERIEWHLNNIAESRNGKLVDYHIYED